MDAQTGDDDVVVLYRPVGQKELALIKLRGWRGFPARLPAQPIFYPVLNETYAVEIAREWNAHDAANGNVGYVTRFAVRRRFLDAYDVHRVGGRSHEEYWIPAEDLPAFNENIVGEIEIVGEYRGGNQGGGGAATARGRAWGGGQV